MQQTVVVLQDDEDTLQNVVRSINTKEDYSVVGSSTDGEEGLEILLAKKPDIVIIDIILKRIDGFSVLEKIKSLKLNCKVVVLSNFTRDSVIKKALEFGAEYYIAKPFNEEILIKRLNELTNKSEEKGVPKKKELDEKISKIIINVGIPPHIKGYQYLREGVKMAVGEPTIINNITKQLYPKIGEKYETSPSKVERAIRHAIEVAWNRGRIDSINTLFGIRAYVGNDKPTNGEFIALIADKLILEGAYC